MNQSPRFAAIPGFPGYAVSDHGDVISFKYGGFHFMKSAMPKNGYKRVSLCVGSSVVRKGVHEVVASAFIGNNPGGMQVCHGDGNPENNKVDNLRWGTAKDNATDRALHGRFSPPRGESHALSKLNEVSVREIRKSMLSQRKLAAQYGVSQHVICCVKNRETWQHVEDDK